MALNVSLNTSKTNNASLLALANVEALADPETNEGGDSKWFSNLNYVECPIYKVNGAAAFYYKGVLIPAYGSYIAYGSKKVCERELTTNTCNTNNQTPCKE